MYLPANHYAIGPGLHDEAREAYELEEIARTAREEACNADFACWERLTYCDRNQESGKKHISEMMNAALDLILDSETMAEQFRQKLFHFYCSNDHVDELRGLIHDFLFEAYSKSWEYD
jgi:hypothetical protein